MFQAARKAFAELSHGFTGTHEHLAAQLVRIVEAFLRSDRLGIPSLFHSDPLRRRILIALNIDLVVQHVLSNVAEQNTERLTPVFDEENPIGATGHMRTWYTTKPCFRTTKSHISHLVGDSAWEAQAANVFEKREDARRVTSGSEPQAACSGPFSSVVHRDGRRSRSRRRLERRRCHDRLTR